MSFYAGCAWVMNQNKQLRIKADVAQNWGIPAPTAACTATPGAVDAVTLNPFNADSLLAYAGYYDGNRVFQDRPQQTTVITDQGTITVTNGSADVVGDGTNWDTTMIGANISISGYQSGVAGTWLSYITAVADATHLTLAVPYSFDSGAGVSYALQTTTAGVSYGVAVDGVGTIPTLVDSSVSYPWYLVTEYSPGHDSTTNGAAQDADVFHFPFYADDPAAIDSLIVTLYSNQDSLGQNAPIVQATIAGSSLSQSAQTWTDIQIARAVNLAYSGATDTDSATGDTYPDPTAFAAWSQTIQAALGQPHFMEYIGSYPQFTGYGPTWQALMSGQYPIPSSGGFGLPSPFNWANITGMEIQVVLKSPCTFGFGAVTMDGTVPGSLTGTVSYYYSWANADGEDGNPSPAVDVAVNGQGVSLSGFQNPTDPQITERWIYRIGGGSSQALMVGKQGAWDTSTFLDTMDVPTAQDNGIVMPVNRTLPPLAAGVMGPFFGKLIAWGTVSNPARYYWTQAGQPWFFPGADDVTGNWEDAGNDDDPIVSIVDHKLMAVIYKQRSIWRLYGDPATSDPARCNANIGLVGPRAVCNAGQVDYFVGPEGIYTFNGDLDQKISGPLDPLFKGDFTMLATGEWVPPVDRTELASSVLEIVNDRLRWSYQEAGASGNNVVLVYHTKSGRWARERYVNLPATAPQAMHYEGSGNFLMAGFAGGYLYRLEDIAHATDGGQPIHVVWQSKASDQGLPDNQKWYSDVELDYQTAGGAETPGTLTVYLILDDQRMTLGTVSSATRTTQIFQLSSLQGGNPDFGIKGKRACVAVSGDVSSTCIIYGAYLHWYPVERSVRSFDSGFIGTERVRQVDYLEFVATGSGQAASYILSSDLPGGALVRRQFAGWTVPNGRGTSRFRLPSIVEGRNMRLTVAADTALQLHSARVRQREIGEYIDGTIGEYWESPEFSVAPGREGELKDLLLDYDASDGGGQLVLYCDQPGNSLQVWRTLAIPAGPRHTHVFPFETPDGTLPYGTLFKIRVVPDSGGIIRLHGRATIRARLIGVSFQGASGERWQTQPLDLVGGIGEFREVAIVSQTDGPMLFEMFTEIFGEGLQKRCDFMLAPATGRAHWSFRLPGGTKGRLQQFSITGTSYCRLFEVKVYGRLLGGNPTPWAWITVPVEPTSDEWANIQMPVRATPEEFTWVDVPVDGIE